MSHCTVNSKIKMPMEITACTAHWNGSMFNYTLHWRVPEFIAYGSGIFNNFLVEATLQFEGKTLSFFSNHFIQKQPDQTLYEYTWINFEPQAPEKIYDFHVSCKCGFVCEFCSSTCTLFPTDSCRNTCFYLADRWSSSGRGLMCTNSLV